MTPRVIDTQVHLNMVGLDEGLREMDALGIDGMVIDEYISPNPTGGPQIGSFVTDTVFRYETPFSLEAVRRHPDRFRFVARVLPEDPEVVELVSRWRDTAGCVGLRVIPHQPLRPGALSPYRLSPPEDLRARLRDGRFDRMLDAASDVELPVFLQVSGVDLPGDLELFEAVARRHPRLPLVLDHAGLSLAGSPADTADGFRELDRVLELAALPNVTVKWCHMVRLSDEGRPWHDVRRALHRVVGAFGAARVMWASDYTVDGPWATWADALALVAADEGLDRADRELVLGGTAARVLGWD